MRTVKTWVAIGLCMAAWSGMLSAGTALYSNVPEASGYTLVYELPIPLVATNWYLGDSTIPYAVNNTASIPDGTFSRIAYYLELVQLAGPTQWVYVSIDAFTNVASKIGVPSAANGTFFNYSNTPILNANIFSSEGNITTGTSINTVNLEFWTCNYDAVNGYGVLGASDSAFDFGDRTTTSLTSPGHGSMQIHNYGAGQTLFGINNFGKNTLEILQMGIGTQSSGNPDWTFNGNNVTNFSKRTLQVLVKPMAICHTAPTNVTSASAVLNATLYATGSLHYVSVYIGKTDGGTNRASWETNKYVGSYLTAVPSNISYTVGLARPDTTYYYRFLATNAVGAGDWAPRSDSVKSSVTTKLARYYKMPVVFNGYDKSETLTNFPTLVIFNESITNFLYRTLQSGAEDLRFLDAAGISDLSYEIEEWNTNGNSYVWVCVPAFTNYCSIWACWGSAETNRPAYVTDGSTWKTGYKGVWHLCTNANDSTANSYNGTVFGSSSVPIGGRIAYGWNFNGNDDYIRVSRMIQNDFTIAFWMYTTNTSLTGTQWYNGNGLVDGEVSGGGNDGGVTYLNNHPVFGTGNADITLDSGVSVNDGVWHHVLATRERVSGAKKIFVDAVDCGIQYGSTNLFDLPTYLMFGQIQTGNNRFGGRLDEIQISDVVRSANWTWASWMNQGTSHGSFATYGPVTRAPDPGTIVIAR